MRTEKLKTLHHDRGWLGVAFDVGRSLATSICSYQIQEVRGRIILDKDPPTLQGSSESHPLLHCVFIESKDAIEAFAAEIPSTFRDSVEAMRKRLDEGCVVIPARRAKENGAGHEVVGYSIMERGGFSAAGINGKLSNDSMFVHYTEVGKEHRGQRIAQVLTRARNDYCRKNGIKRSFTAHTPGNTSSERAFRKAGSRLLCYAVRISFLRGLYVWHTPWTKIDRAIAGLDTGENR